MEPRLEAMATEQALSPEWWPSVCIWHPGTYPNHFYEPPAIWAILSPNASPIHDWCYLIWETPDHWWRGLWHNAVCPTRDCLRMTLRKIKPWRSIFQVDNWIFYNCLYILKQNPAIRFGPQLHSLVLHTYLASCLLWEVASKACPRLDSRAET